jgi:hypothetical protein
MRTAELEARGIDTYCGAAVSAEDGLAAEPTRDAPAPPAVDDFGGGIPPWQRRHHARSCPLAQRDRAGRAEARADEGGRREPAGRACVGCAKRGRLARARARDQCAGREGGGEHGDEEEPQATHLAFNARLVRTVPHDEANAAEPTPPATRIADARSATPTSPSIRTGNDAARRRPTSTIATTGPRRRPARTTERRAAAASNAMALRSRRQ